MHTAAGFKEQNTTGGSIENILGGEAGLKTLHKGMLICVAWFDWFAEVLPHLPTPSVPSSLSLSLSFLSPSPTPLSQTDPTIIGGMVVEIGDKYIDMTTSTKIKKILQSLTVSL